ncbi:unnamed protein product [Linum trigynum]|uniref:Uncharacterized protein n=1 Tax=Linum trigynum TaxID=586398 RepID=A0AAV2FWR1_9ROSI
MHEPYKRVSSDSEPFLIPNLLEEILMTWKQLPEYARKDGESRFGKLMKSVRESELKSYDVIANIFFELERDYADYCKASLRRRAWHSGPLSLCNNNNEKESERGKQALECLKWIAYKGPGSAFTFDLGACRRSGQSN